jgi:hypothetical protein
MRNREELVRRLTDKPLLAKAVRWYDPGVLVRVGIRDSISAVFGEYADQRLMQAATDRVTKDELVERYDYSGVGDADNPLMPDAHGACWVDYIADVGDGFGPTYSMASLLAKPQLTLKNLPNETLPAANLLILGGDQCYPQATHEEYEKRFVLPYATAFPPPEDKSQERMLFALPGNHDWYDGLGAFDSLFCQNRDHLLGREHGRGIGGWRCHQHRSYWALRLPHNWWIWGVDIQFSKYLDAAQESYFRAIVDSMEGGEHETVHHNIVLCIAEPHWLNAEFEGIDTVDSLHTIVRIALKKTKDESQQRVKNRDVRVRAVLAGDWHHYSHYHLESVKDPRDKTYEVKLDLPLITAGGGGAFLHSTTDLRKHVTVSWGIRPENLDEARAGDPHATAAAVGKGKTKSRLRPRRFTGLAKMVACYPSRPRSALLSLKNLAFPLRNWKFSFVIGALYWIMTWQYHVVTKNTSGLSGLREEIERLDYSTINSLSNRMLVALPDVASENIFYTVLLLGLWAGLASYVTVSAKRTALFKVLVKVLVGTLHALAHLKAMFLVFALCMAFNADAGIPGGFFYPLEAIVFGGLVGGFIFGAYWVLAGLIARMHTGDAFGALGIRNHKNFVRMKFDKNSLTIYPIGVASLPSTKSCTRRLKRNPPKVDGDRPGPLIDVELSPLLIQGKGSAAGPIVVPRVPHGAPKAAEPVVRPQVAAE